MEQKIVEPVVVSITIGDIEVTMKGPEGFVREEIERLASILSSKHQEQKGLGTPELSTSDEEGMNERQLIDVKNPKGHGEIVAVLAFALKYKQALEEFTEEDMKRAYIRAKERPPKAVGQALRDAKNKYDFIEYGNSRGTYKISHHGERTVRFDLPRALGDR